MGIEVSVRTVAHKDLGLIRALLNVFLSTLSKVLRNYQIVQFSSIYFSERLSILIAIFTPR